MLGALRKFAGGWVAMIFIGLLVLSFALFGINDIFSGGGARALAVVGDREVTPQDYQNALRNRTQELSRRFGSSLTLAQLRSLGIPGQTVDRLINEAALDEVAEDYGLTRSPDALAAEIVEGAAFTDAAGNFNRALFNQVLRANGLTEATYIDVERQVSARNQLSYPVRAELPPPAPLADALNRYRLERRTVRAVDVTAEDIEAIGEPTNTVLEAFFEENANRFAAPEYRTFTYISVEPADLTGTVEVSDADIEAEYASRSADYVTPERRTVRQIVFPDAESAAAAADRIAAGEAFDTIANERGAIALGNLTRDEFIDPAVAEAAFALPQGSVSDPVQGQFSTLLVTVDAIEPGDTRPLDEVRDELRQDIALRLAAQGILDAYDAIEDGRAGGETLAEIATRLDLEAVRIDGLARDGSTKTGEGADLPSAPNLLDAVFQADTDFEPDPVQTREGYVFFDLEEVEPTRQRSLEEAREDVMAAWRADEIAGRTSALAREIVEAANGGAALLDVASRRGLTARDIGPIDRSGTAGLSQDAIRQVFATPLGRTASTVAPDGVTRTIFTVISAEMPEGVGEAPQVGLGEDLLSLYIDAVRAEVGVTTNDAVLRATLGSL